MWSCRLADRAVSGRGRVELDTVVVALFAQIRRSGMVHVRVATVRGVFSRGATPVLPAAAILAACGGGGAPVAPLAGQGPARPAVHQPARPAPRRLRVSLAGRLPAAVQLPGVADVGGTVVAGGGLGRGEGAGGAPVGGA